MQKPGHWSTFCIQIRQFCGKSFAIWEEEEEEEYLQDSWQVCHVSYQKKHFYFFLLASFGLFYIFYRNACLLCFVFFPLSSLVSSQLLTFFHSCPVVFQTFVFLAFCLYIFVFLLLSFFPSFFLLPC